MHPRPKRHDLPDRRGPHQLTSTTFVTLGELTKWTALRSWGPRKLADLADWRSGVVVLPIDEAVATTWATSKLGRSTAGDLVRPMTPGSRPTAWWTSCLWRRSNGKDYADFAEYDGLHLFDVS